MILLFSISLNSTTHSESAKFTRLPVYGSRNLFGAFNVRMTNVSYFVSKSKLSDELKLTLNLLKPKQLYIVYIHYFLINKTCLQDVNLFGIKGNPEGIQIPLVGSPLPHNSRAFSVVGPSI